MLYVFIATVLRPKTAPALPAKARSFGAGADYAPVILGLILPISLIVLGMVTLFAPAEGLEIIRTFVPQLADWIVSAFANEGAQMLLMLGLFALIYLVYVGWIRFAPSPLSKLASVALLLLAVLVLWRTSSLLSDSFAQLPPAGERGVYFALDLIVWGAGAWALALAFLALAGSSLTLFSAPQSALAGAIWKIVADLIPPLVLIFLVLGTIFQGIATPTEGGAMGAVGALVLAAAKRRLNFQIIRQALDSTTKLSSFVIFILIGARVFSLTFYGVNGHKWVEDLLVSLPGGQLGFLVFVNALVFVLAFFLDFFELAFIIVPLLAGPAETLGIDLIWFGVLLAINMQTSFMHPPFGFALFYLRSVAPRDRFRDRLTGRMLAPVTTGQIYWGAVPFVIIQLIMVGLAIAFPQMIMHYKGPAAGTQPAIEIEIPGGGDDTQVPPPSFE
jgi:TRAP-type mannitol/chloroaromatic compound transport system permease large subunit